MGPGFFLGGGTLATQKNDDRTTRQGAPAGLSRDSGPTTMDQELPWPLFSRPW